MSLKRFQLPYLTTAQRVAVIITDRDLVFDADLNSIFVGDGVTMGGIQTSAGSSGEVYTLDEKTKLDGIAYDANNYTHPNHTGEVTSYGEGNTVIVNGAIIYEKLNASLIQRSAINEVDINWAAAAIFTKSINAVTTFTFTSIQVNKVITLILTGGNYAVTMPNYCRRISGSYQAGVFNYIQLHCTNDADDSEEVWYTISQGGV